jgi:sensor histidine kinase YesM
MKGYQKDWIENKNTIKKLEEFCTGSKVVFLSTQKHFIVNEKLGYWEEGIWYSNDAHTYSWKNTTSQYGYFPATKKDVISEGIDYGIEEGDTISSLYIDNLRSLIDRAYLNSQWDEVLLLEDELEYIEQNCFISDDSYADDDDWIPNSNKGFHFVNDYLCKNS